MSPPAHLEAADQQTTDRAERGRVLRARANLAWETGERTGGPAVRRGGPGDSGRIGHTRRPWPRRKRRWRSSRISRASGGKGSSLNWNGWPPTKSSSPSWPECLTSTTASASTTFTVTGCPNRSRATLGGSWTGPRTPARCGPRPSPGACSVSRCFSRPASKRATAAWSGAAICTIRSVRARGPWPGSGGPSSPPAEPATTKWRPTCEGRRVSPRCRPWPAICGAASTPRRHSPRSSVVSRQGRLRGAGGRRGERPLRGLSYLQRPAQPGRGRSVRDARRRGQRPRLRRSRRAGGRLLRELGVAGDGRVGRRKRLGVDGDRSGARRHFELAADLYERAGQPFWSQRSSRLAAAR